MVAFLNESREDTSCESLALLRIGSDPPHPQRIFAFRIPSHGDRSAVGLPEGVQDLGVLLGDAIAIKLDAAIAVYPASSLAVSQRLQDLHLLNCLEARKLLADRVDLCGCLLASYGMCQGDYAGEESS